MPQPAFPPEVEQSLAAVSDDLKAVWDRIKAEEAALLAAWPEGNRPARVARLQALQQSITELMQRVQSVIAGDVPRTIANAYELGAWGTALQVGSSAAFTAVDLDAATRLAQDAMTDLLAATQYVGASSKELIQKLARDHIRDSIYSGVTAQQAARALALELAENSITSVIYSNGARVGLDQYAEMVLRTKTAIAYQEGGFQQGTRLDIQWWEIMDGPDCGLSYHEDPQLADGLIVDADTAAKYPISHPNCVRVTSPRPDIITKEDAKTAHRTSSDEQVADQAAASRARAQAKTAGRKSLADQVSAGANQNLLSSGVAVDRPLTAAEVRQARRLATASEKVQTAAAQVGPEDLSFSDLMAYRQTLSESQLMERGSVVDRWLTRRFDTEEEFDVHRGLFGMSKANDKIRDSYVVDDAATLAMNRRMREGAPLTPKMKKIEDLISQSTIKEPLTAFRGAALTDDVVERLVPGARWSDLAFQSTDLTRNQALWYADQRIKDGARGRLVLFKYQLEPGMQARYVGSGEVVVQRGTQFVVEKVVDEDGVLTVFLKAVS